MTIPSQVNELQSVTDGWKKKAKKISQLSNLINLRKTNAFFSPPSSLILDYISAEITTTEILQ